MTTPRRRRRSPILNQAYSHWRLAAKARKAGQSNLAAHHQRTGDRLHARWAREQEAIRKMTRRLAA